MIVILLDGWSALFHRSSYCLLGGLSGRKQVLVQIASENHISKLSPSLSYDGPQARLPLTALVLAHVIVTTHSSPLKRVESHTAFCNRRQDCAK